jgi:mycothiol synthase
MNSILARLVITLQSVYKKIKWLLFGDQTTYQLELFLPIHNKRKIEFSVPEIYYLRIYTNDDKEELINLMHLAGFTDWDAEKLQQALHLTVPDGCFVLFAKNSNKCVATMMARHLSDERHPCGGRIDWLAAAQEHQGRGLGFIVAAAATNRLIEINYRNIYVTTDDHRLPAIKTFIKLGFIPDLYRKDMFARWKNVCRLLSIPFLPEQWLKLIIDKNDV